MATYIELRNLFSDDEFANRVDIATVKAAHNMLIGTPTVEQINWAAAVFSNPRSESSKAHMAVLAASSTATVAQIEGASDTVIQTNVDAIVDSLVSAYNT